MEIPAPLDCFGGISVLQWSFCSVVCYIGNFMPISAKNRAARISILLSLAFLTLSGVYFLFFKRNPTLPVNKNRASIYEGVSLKDLSFNEYENNEKLFSVKIGSLNVKRAKIGGFLKIGFWKVAELNDVVFNVNEKYIMPNKIPSGSSSINQRSSINQQGKTSPNLINHIANNEQMVPLKMNKVKEIKFSNLTMNVIRDKEIVSTISSTYARIDSQKKKLILEGQVKISTGNKEALTCSEMYFMGQDKEFNIEGLYVLTVGNKVYKGKGMKTNYLLEGARPVEL